MEDETIAFLDDLSHKNMSPLQASKFVAYKYKVDEEKARDLIDWYVNHVNPSWANEFRHV